MIEPSTSTLGNYTVTYTTAGTCTNSSDVAIAITNLDDSTFNYTATSYCMSDTTQSPTTVVPGGSFVATPAGLSIDPTTGVIDPTTSNPDTYTITYATPGVCSSSTNVVVTIIPLEDASFNYSTIAYCIDDTTQTPSIAVPGGTFSVIPAGLSIDLATGVVNPAASIAQTYTITYTTPGLSLIHI